MNPNVLRQIAVVLAVVAVIAVNGLANALPLNGQMTGEISDRFQVFFVPAGYVFSIWGLIYLGLVLFAIYQALPAQRDNPLLSQIGYLFVFSCLANIVWLFLWHYEQFPLTVVAMLALLLSLIAIYLRLRIGQASVPAGERWLVQIPFSVYLGWVCVATIANVTDVLDYLQWDGWGVRPELWAVIMLVATVGITAAMIFSRGDVAFTLVILWALAGIAVKQSGTAAVANTAWVLVGVLVILLMLYAVLQFRRM